MVATIDTRFSEEQHAVLNGHLARMEWEILPRIHQALEQTRHGIEQMQLATIARSGASAHTSGFSSLMGIHQLRTSSEVPRLEFCFGFDALGQAALSDLEQIMDMFQVVGRILNDPGTRIDPYSAGSVHPEAYLWGRAVPPNGILIGPAFFAPQPDDQQLLNVPADRIDRLKIARDSILAHESVHCHNGLGQHEARGVLANPYRYQAYLITFLAQVERLNHTPVELEQLIG